jgi:hypothetical protein
MEVVADVAITQALAVANCTELSSPAGCVARRVLESCEIAPHLDGIVSVALASILSSNVTCSRSDGDSVRFFHEDQACDRRFFVTKPASLQW